MFSYSCLRIIILNSLWSNLWISISGGQFLEVYCISLAELRFPNSSSSLQTHVSVYIFQTLWSDFGFPCGWEQAGAYWDPRSSWGHTWCGAVYLSLAQATGVHSDRQLCVPRVCIGCKGCWRPQQRLQVPAAMGPELVVGTHSAA